MAHRVISNFQFRCWASCPGPSSQDNKSRLPSPSSQALTRLYTTPHKTRTADEAMGFFSSRKTDDSEGYVTTTTTTTVATSANADKSMVQVIRSRFYGKKGKEREVEQQPPPSATTNNRKPTTATSAAAQILSPPSSSSNHGHASISIGASPRPSTSQRMPLPPSILQKNYGDRPLPVTPSKRQSVEVVAPLGSATSSRSRNGPTTPNTKSADTTVVLSPTPPRKHADNVTVTLAQRLNELAVANSEGRLNDDDYRLLRQSLFDRFASSAVVPQEEPIVPAAKPRPKKSYDNPDGRPLSRPLSNFQVEMPRPNSIHSRNSMTFGDLIRRATGRRSSSATKDSDASSVWSAKSGSSKLFRLPRVLSKKSSDSSINTTGSRIPVDAVSISSKRARANSDRGNSDSGHPFSPSGNRSATGSIRKLKTPPSSFPTRIIGQDTKYANSIRDVFDEDTVKTALDIQKEILAVEAEQRRLMDAFNGLELTTLSKARRHHHARSSLKAAGFGQESNADSSSHWSDTRSHKRFNPSESDALSIRSGTSAGTAPSVAPSMARSAYSNRSKPLRAKKSHNLNPSVVLTSPLHRKTSSSSVTSTDRWADRSLSAVPPVPGLPTMASHGHLKAATNSSISLARSTGHLPMDVVHEDEDKSLSGTIGTVRMEDEIENEMDDIRRRREEVCLRYEARLEYLRAKLKGAQLHEKLMKK